MGPLQGRLPPGAAAGKALGEMASSEASFNAPAGSNGCKRLEHEAALVDPSVRDVEAPRAEPPAAPQCKIEIEHAWTPAASAAAAEVTLHRLEVPQHLRRLEIALDERDGIGEIPASAAMSGIKHDWRGIEQAEVMIEPRDCSFHDTRRPPEASVRPIGPNRDRV